MKVKNKIFLTTIACLSTCFFIQSMEQQDNVKLESSDEQQFQVPLDVVEKSGTIKDLVKELAEIVAPMESIYLPNVSGEVLGFILNLLREDLKNKELISGKISEKIKELFQSNPVFGYQFLAAVNYLNISDLLPVAITSVGQLMNDQIKEENKKDALEFGLESIPPNLESQIKEIVINENIVLLLNKFTSSRILRHYGCSGIRLVAFSPDSKYILTVHIEAKLWDLNTGNLFRTFTHHNSIKSVAFSPDGKYILTGSSAKTLKLGDIDTGDKTVKLWGINTGKLIRDFNTQTAYVRSVAFSPDGKYIIATTGGGGNDVHNAKLWNKNTGKLIGTFTHLPFSIELVAFSPNGKYILTTSDDRYRTIKLWDTNTGNFIREMLLDVLITFNGHTDYIRSVAFSPDGKFFLTGSHDGTAKLWDTDTGNLLRTFPNPFPVFSQDGKYILTADNKVYERILTGSGDITAKLWDLNTGDLIRIFTGHTDGITSIAFSPDGRYVLTGSKDKTAKLWDANTGSLIHIFTGHNLSVDSVAFSPDGRYICTGSSDISAILWDISVSIFDLRSIVVRCLSH